MPAQTTAPLAAPWLSEPTASRARLTASRVSCWVSGRCRSLAGSGGLAGIDHIVRPLKERASPPSLSAVGVGEPYAAWRREAQAHTLHTARSGSVPTVSVAYFDGDLSPGVSQVLRAQPSVAVDTETSGLDWAADRLLLCQLFSPATGPVLLRNVSGVPSELAALMADPEVSKVFHHAPFDLRFLEAKWGIRTVSVTCTKAASKLLNPEAAHEDHSLKSVLRRYLGVTVEKGHVRTSDWGASVLSLDQINYAKEDVIHLLELQTVFSESLRGKDLTDIYAQVCAYMPLDAHLEVSGVPNPLTY